MNRNRYLNHIDGRTEPSKSGKTTDLVDPSTGEVYGEASLSGPEDVGVAMEAATRGFATWSRTTPSARQLAMLKLADLVEEHAGELTEVECRSTGKPLVGTREEELPPIVDQLRFFAGAARCLEGRSGGEYVEGTSSVVRREPLGVCAQITPWNYPLMMAVWKIAPALAAGNTVVLKPAPSTPETTVMLAELCSEVLPPGVVNVVCGDNDTGRAMVTHPVPSLVSLTGSTRAGREVATLAASGLKRLHLELGGKAPVVVFDTADLAAAAAGIAFAGLTNAGQDCTAATRILVHERVAEEFLASLLDEVAKIRTGPPSDEQAFYGPLNNTDQLARLIGFLDRLPSHAEVLAGGRRVGDKGFFFSPTVVAGLRQDDEMIQEECFGPVLTVQTFADEAEAIARANGVPYGLASSIWSQNHAQVLRVSSALDFGVVWVNTHLLFAAEMPHGGFKDSGYGKDLSSYSFEDYTRIKHVMSSIEA